MEWYLDPNEESCKRKNQKNDKFLRKVCLGRLFPLFYWKREPKLSNRPIAKSPEDLATQEQFASMSGLEFMEGVRDGKLPGPPIGDTLNFQVHAVESGQVVFRGTPEFAYANPMGTIHGGWYGTLLDSCMSCAVMTKVAKGYFYTTLEYKVNITRSIPLGVEIEAIGTVQHSGRSTGVANGEIRGVEDGRLYATGSATCIIMKMPT